MNASDKAFIKALPGNNRCADCGMMKNPQWASVSFGTLFCLECSGAHRSLGVHISFVRSLVMDSWTDQQLSIMKVGGNDAYAKYLIEHGISSSAPIRQKYENSSAQFYKEILKARSNGLPEPKSFPSDKAADKIKNNNLQGDCEQQIQEELNEYQEHHIEEESKKEYQSTIQQESKARMQKKFGNNYVMNGVGSCSPPTPRSRFFLISSLYSLYCKLFYVKRLKSKED